MSGLLYPVEAPRQPSDLGEEAYRELFERHWVALQRFCESFLHSPQDAEDAAQETMLRAHLAGRFAAQPVGIGWLRKVARNLCIDELRSARRRTRAGDAADLADPAETSSELTEVLTAVAELPARQRRALVLRVFEGRSHRELAADLGTTPSAAKSLLCEARHRLRAGRALDGGGPAPKGRTAPDYSRPSYGSDGNATEPLP